MSERQKGTSPYKLLGSRLKRLREKMQESLAEVSGAVEIDIALLAEYEQGAERPSEDILLLLISHFGIKDDEATKLWELASYEQQRSSSTSLMADDMITRQTTMMMPIVYTDMVHVMVNNYGVIMNFLQSSGSANQPLAISRVGMSKEHARSVLELLQKTLDQSETKALPAPIDPSEADKQA